MELYRATDEFDHLSRQELIELILKLQAECSKRPESTRDGSVGEDMILEIVGGEKQPVGACYDIRSKNGDLGPIEFRIGWNRYFDACSRRILY